MLVVCGQGQVNLWSRSSGVVVAVVLVVVAVVAVVKDSDDGCQMLMMDSADDTSSMTMMMFRSWPVPPSPPSYCRLGVVQCTKAYCVVVANSLMIF